MLPFKLRLRLKPKPWDEVDRLVWDPLGGRDNLVLMLGAYAFGSHVIKYGNRYRHRTSNQSDPISIVVRTAAVWYREPSGLRMVLKISESHMEKDINPSLVLFDVKPAPMTWVWLRWILTKDADGDVRYHRSRFEASDLFTMGPEKIRINVEDVTKMRLEF